jgi:hypothetical protein
VIRHTTFFEFAPGLASREREEVTAALQRIPDQVDGVVAHVVAPPLEGSVVAGGADGPVRAADLTVITAFADDASRGAADSYDTRVLEPMIAACCRTITHVVYEQGPVRLREPGLRDGVQRTLLLRVVDDAPAEAVAAFEAELAAMPEYIDSIRNSSLSRVIRTSPNERWTHVWEQEFTSVEGLTGPYMLHPYHWAVIDGWFDDECPRKIVDRRLLHSFCELPESVLRHAVAG